MARITLNGEQIEADGTLLEAARERGVDVPTLCYLPGRPAKPSCMLCVVKVGGRLLPACGTRAEEGMVVETDADEVLEARRMAIELLLSDHVGDCIAPCQSVCPAGMAIPRMMHLIAARRFREALIVVKEDIALPAVLGRVCPELCEKGCRRGPHDGAVSVCMLKRFVADRDLSSGDPFLPECAPAAGKRVAIVGAGPAGLSSAYYLQQRGHACTLFDEHEKPGGMLRYGVSPDVLLPDVLSAEVGLTLKLGAVFEQRRIEALDELSGFDAVLVATGSPERCLGEGPNVFHTGGAVTPLKHAVRAVADGKSAALQIDAFLAGKPTREDRKPFSFRAGTMDAAEVAAMAGGVSERGVSRDGLTEGEAVREASRCLHCDCAKAGECKLRAYASTYGAQAGRFKGARRAFGREETNPVVTFEPGKCIACGICVRIAAERREQLGLTFVGRGFSVRTAVPFGKDLSDGLRKAALECADACPTGALTRKLP